MVELRPVTTMTMLNAKINFLGGGYIVWIQHGKLLQDKETKQSVLLASLQKF